MLPCQGRRLLERGGTRRPARRGCCGGRPMPAAPAGRRSGGMLALPSPRGIRTPGSVALSLPDGASRTPWLVRKVLGSPSSNCAAGADPEHLGRCGGSISWSNCWCKTQTQAPWPQKEVYGVPTRPPRSRLQQGLREHIASVTAGGLVRPQPREDQIPAGSQHSGEVLMLEGRAAAPSSHPCPIPCSAAADHSVLMPPSGGGNSPGAEGKSLPGRRRDGGGGGGSTCSHSPRGYVPKGAGHRAQRGGCRGTGRMARAGRAAWGKPGTGRGGAGASHPAVLVLLSPPVAHLEQKFRGCPGTGAVPGCRRESSAAASRGDAACRCPSPLPLSPARYWHRPRHATWKKLLTQLWDKASQQQCVVPTAGFTFPVLPMALEPGVRSLQPLAGGSAREAGGSGSMAAGGLEALGLPRRDSCQTSAAGGGWLQPSSGGENNRGGRFVCGSARPARLPFGGGGPRCGRVEQHAALGRSRGDPGTLVSPVLPPARHGGDAG